MYVKFWGTRGSLPRPMVKSDFLTWLEDLITDGKSKGVSSFDQLLTHAKNQASTQPLAYGGNTSCTEFGHGKDFILVDSGSGIVRAGDAAMARGVKEFHIFQSHFHWDHIMGMPFFIPMYVPGHKVNIYHVHKTAETDTKIQFNGRNFPLTWDQIGGTVEFHQLKLYEPKKIGQLAITPFALDHPGGSFGFRVEAGGNAMAVGVDGEYKRFTPKELGPDHKFYQNLDLFIFDGQYDMDELVSRYDWGHCTPTIGVDLALREGIKNLVFTHHDPRSTDAKSRRMYRDALKYLKSQLPSYAETWNKKGQPDGPVLHSAYDDLEIVCEGSNISIKS